MKPKSALSVILFLSLFTLAGIFSGCLSNPADDAVPIQCMTRKDLASLLPSNSASSEIVINPETLQSLFLNNNLSLLQSATRVHKAKEALNMARGNLLPSINLAGLIQTAANPTFLIASVDILLPFLLPSKWFDLGAQSRITRAEEEAFLLAELNQFASLYGIYLGMLTDYTAREFLFQDTQDALTVERLVRQSYELGQATSADLDSARSQVLSAGTRFTKMEELLTEESSNLKYALGICPDVELTLSSHSLPPSNIESLSSYEATRLALDKAPEAKQIGFLIEASRYEKWSKIFGFINGASFSGQPSANDNAFSNLKPAGSIGIGYGYVVGLSLSNRNMEELKLQQIQLGAETLRIMDSTLTRLLLTAQRVDNALQAERLLERVFESEKQRYAIGETTLLSLTENQGRLRQGRLETIRARFDQDLERLTLHRLMRSESFATLKGCTQNSPCELRFLQKKLGKI